MKVYGLVRVTKDIELKYTQNNKAIVNLSVAENQWNGTDNVGHFFNCVAFGKTAELLSKVQKGDRINIVQAELSNNNYQKDDGSMVYKDQITIFKFDFIEKKEQGSYKESFHSDNERREKPIDVSEDDLPF
jgi:single-strand DNA-binding protein